MNCRSVLRWVLDVDTLVVKDWPRDVNRHLKRCPACGLLARDLYRLEATWRKAPIPTQCATSKAAFLEKLADPVKSKEFEVPDEVIEAAESPSVAEKSSVELPQKSGEFQKSGEIQKPKRRSTPKSQRNEYPPPSAWAPLRWIPFVAIVLFAIGLVLFMFLVKPNQIKATAEIYDQIIDWNIRVVNSTDAQERKLLLNDHEAGFRFQISHAAFSPDQRLNAEDLLNLGRQLAFSSDLLHDADLAFTIQSKLLTQAVAAERSGKARELDRCGVRYSRFTELAVNPLKSRVEKFVSPGQKSKNGDKTGTELSQKLRYETILSRAPEFAQTELHNKFQHYGRKPAKPGVGQ